MFMFKALGPINVNLLEKRIFANVSKDLDKWRSSCINCISPITSVLIRERRREATLILKEEKKTMWRLR